MDINDICKQILLNHCFIKTIYCRCCSQTEETIELQTLLIEYGISIPKFDIYNLTDPAPIMNMVYKLQDIYKNIDWTVINGCHSEEAINFCMLIEKIAGKRNCIKLMTLVDLL